MEEKVKPNLKDFLIYIGLIIAITVGLIFFFSQNNASQSTTNTAGVTPSSTVNYKQYSEPPKMEIDTKKSYTATLATNKGSITIELTASETPVTVNNFVFLAKQGFYDGTTFHRVVKGFMIQGGDPRGDGTGGPGYKFPDEKVVGDYKRGTVAMANSGPNTNGSQFFIMQEDNLNLPKNYVIFGHVIAGMDTVDKIADTPVVDNGQGEQSKPTEKIVIEKISVSEK